MKSEFTLNGDIYQITTITGIAIDAANERVVTQKTTTSGGGGMIVNGTGMIDDVETVTETKVDEHLRLVLRDAEGIEHHFNFKNEPVAVRAGNIVSVISGCKNGKGADKDLIVHNHATRISVALDPFANKAAIPNLHMAGAVLAGILVAAALSLAWYFYIILPLAGMLACRFYHFNVKKRITALDYLKSQPFKDWMQDIRRDDDRFAAPDAPAVSQAG
jgi:hypothetical protein